MSDIKVEIDIREAVDDLQLNEQRLLVQYLKKEMGESFDTPIPEEDKAKFYPMEATVWLDVDDVVDDMDNYDRRRVYDDLKEEFEEDEPENSAFKGQTYSEEEFGKVLTQLWDDRWYLSSDQKSRIAAITKESFA
jgi:hypothetical protein